MHGFTEIVCSQTAAFCLNAIISNLVSSTLGMPNIELNNISPDEQDVEIMKVFLYAQLMYS